jgi:hypothetical protein
VDPAPGLEELGKLKNYRESKLWLIVSKNRASANCCRACHLQISEYYRVFRTQTDWTLTLRSAVPCESQQPLAKQNAAVRQELVAHAVCCFRSLLFKLTCARISHDRFLPKNLQVSIHLTIYDIALRNPTIDSVMRQLPIVITIWWLFGFPGS